MRIYEYEPLIKLTQWFCFTVTVALIPLGFSAFRVLKEGESQNQEQILTKILGTGDLLIVAVAIDGDAIGEIIATEGAMPTIVKIPVVAACVLLIAFVSYGYAELSSNLNTPRTEKVEQFAVKVSIYFFLASLLVSGLCKLLVALEL